MSISHCLATSKRRGPRMSIRFRLWIENYSDAFVIVHGDFNKRNLSHDMPKYRQQIKCPTREEDTLDHCFATVPTKPPPSQHTDHVPAYLIPAYRQKLKLSKPVVRISIAAIWSTPPTLDINSLNHSPPAEGCGPSGPKPQDTNSVSSRLQLPS